MAKGAEVKFAFEGVEQLKKCLEKVGVVVDDTNPEIKNVILETAGKKWLARARSLVPVRSGALYKALYVTKGGKKTRGVMMGVRRRVTINGKKVDTKYAWYVEHGTSKTPEHAYFRPALMAMASSFAADIAPGVKKLVEETAAKNAYHAGS